MKKISIIFILLSFSSFIWADNNEKGVYVAKFYIEYENVSNYLSNLGGINIRHDFALIDNNKKETTFYIHSSSFNNVSSLSKEITTDETIQSSIFYSNFTSVTST